MRRWRVTRWTVHLVVLVVALSGCKVRSVVDVRVNPNGSGLVKVSVGLDPEAVKRVGDLRKLETKDLGEGGWRLDGPSRPDAQGFVWLTARKQVSDFTKLGPVLSEVLGDPPVFDGFRLQAVDGFAVTRYRVTGRVNVPQGLLSLTDPKATQVLGGLGLGRTPEELQAEGANTPGNLDLRLRVELPGRVTASNGTSTTTPTGTARLWVVPLQEGSTTAIRIRSESTVRSHSSWYLLYGGAALIGLGALSALLTWRRAARVRRLS